MSSLFKQIGPLLAMGLRTLPQRKGTSGVVVIGITGVVAVLVSVLAIVAGLDHTLRGNGRPDTVVLLSSGAEGEAGSVLSRADYDIVGSVPDIAADAAGKLLLSPEISTMFPARFRATGTEANLGVRGIGVQGFGVHPGIQVVDGRAFQPGLRELLVGVSVASRFEGFATGDSVQIGNTVWTVVGHFASGDLHDSEVLADVDTLQSAMEMGGTYNAIYLRMKSADLFQVVKDEVTHNPSLHLDVQREPEFLASQAGNMTDGLRRTAYVIGIIMALGALFGAIHALYISADARRIEMATLRAIGFAASGVMLAFLIEALMLALLGGGIGAALSWLLFNGHTASTIGAGASQVVFQLRVSPLLIAQGLLLACAIGLLGALIPAIRSSRLSVVEALRP
jgi:putative ABC transport system permease protein